jgi:hypothetical protein
MSSSKAANTQPALLAHRAHIGDTRHEHSVSTQGVTCGIDSFDQWGVGLGKMVAERMTAEAASADNPPGGAR